jgi:biopolymer transport protein ExbD
MYRRRNRHSNEEVTINLAAMLDMAFQLLAFFILTFRPNPIEGHLAIHLPKAGSASTIASSSSGGESNVIPSEFKESYIVIANADAGGNLAKVSAAPGGDIFVGGSTADHLGRLNRAMTEAFNQSGAYEQVEILVDPKLRYDELMKLVDVCLRQTLPDGTPMQNIRFSRLSPDSSGP